MLGSVHHWAVVASQPDHLHCYAQAAGIRAYHMNHGYRDSAYNAHYCQHGGEYWWYSGPNQASGDTWANLNLTARCAMIGPGEAPSAALLNAMAASIDREGERGQIYPHSYFYNTACCGDDLRAWIASGAGYTLLPPPSFTYNIKEFDVFKMHSPTRAAVVTEDEVYTCAFDGTQPYVIVDDATYDFIVNDVRAKRAEGRKVRL
jgi:hypothetical protein